MLSLSHFSKKPENRIAFVILSICIILPLSLLAQEVKQEITDMLATGDTKRAAPHLRQAGSAGVEVQAAFE